LNVLRDLISTGDAAGDPELVEQLVGLRGRLTRMIAAAVVDLDAEPGVRWAHLTTNKPRTVTSPEVKVDADPKFELGSIAKGLTGMLLADAIGRGELTLETTAGEVLAADPELQEQTEGPLHTITLRELCTHTSGLPRLPRTAGTTGRVVRYALLGMDPYRGQSAERVLRDAAAQTLQHRGRYRYSNLGGAVAGQLLAIAAGGEYPALLHDRIFQPLQMTSSTVAVKGGTAARGRTKSGLGRQPWVLDGYAPAGGVISTIEDVARLTAALVDGSAPGIESLSALHDVAPSAPGREAGMFWIIEPLPPLKPLKPPTRRERPDGDPESAPPTAGPVLTWHNGMTGGYSAFLGVEPKARRGVAVLTDTARAEQPRALALRLLGSLGGRR
jgi:CubicO group peptidase (beta-lactamase class C family)